jgi:hypothetical protein
MKMKKYSFAFLLAMTLLTNQLGTVAADKSTPPAAIQWDGSTPMQQGQLYRLPSCKGNTDPQAPCYVTILASNQSTGTTEILSATALTQTLQCLVKVNNNLGGWVASLWENVNITWNASNYATENWAALGTSTVNGFYSWHNTGGPTPSSGTINFNFGPTSVSSWGDVYYLGFSWSNNHRVDMHITGNQSWYCTGF